jgi:hypothetical protein
MDGTRVSRGRRWWPLALLALISASGCAMFDGEPNFRDDTAQWGETVRPVKPGNGLGGLSSEAKQIERNLGIQ